MTIVGGRRSPSSRASMARWRPFRAGAAVVTGVWLGLASPGCGPSDPLAEVRALHERGRFEESLDPLRSLMDERGDDPEVLYLYGVALSGTRQITQAVWPLRRAMESPDWYAPAALHLAQLAIATTDWDMATELLDEMIEREPDDRRLVVMRAYARAQSRQDYEGALADAEAVLALEPENSDALVLRAVALLGLDRVEEAGEAIDAVATHHDEVGLGLAGSPRFCVVRATFAKEKGELELAEERFEGCLEESPLDFVVVDESVQFFDDRGRPERSLEILRAAFEGAPGVRAYRLSLVHRLAARGEIDEAEALMREATDVALPEASAAAYADLARFYFAHDRLDDAIAAFEEALARVPDPGPELLFTYADALVAAGRHDEALAVADRMTLVAHRELVRGRVALDRGDPQSALDHFTEGQKLWPNNAVARYFAALAAEAVGDFERAIEEYRYSIRAEATATDARMRLARLYAAMGDDEQAVHAVRHEKDHKPGPTPIDESLYELELLARLGRAAQLPPRLLSAIRPPAVWPEALAAMARGVRANRGPAASARLVLEADRLDLTAPANAPALASLVADLVALDRVAEARRRVDAARDAHPDASAFRALDATVLAAEGAPPPAIDAAWRRAIELDPANADALRGRAAHREALRDEEEALRLYALAAEADATDTGALRAIARLETRLGHEAEAEAAWRRLLERDPYDGPAAASLARLLIARGAALGDEAVVRLQRRAEVFAGARGAAGSPAAEAASPPAS